MYEGCLATVPLIHNQKINVTYPVTIWALQSGILYRLYMLKVVNNTTSSLVVLLTTFNIYKFHTHNEDDIP